MSEMVERVTFAVCPILRAADECDFPQILHGPRPECRKCPPTEPRGGTAGCRVIAEIVARAAIAALREPTPAMVEAGTEALWSDCPMGGTAWRAMIDAALETQKAAAPEGTADTGDER